MPGIAASTSETCELGSAPNAVAAPENSLAREFTWAWTSMPTTTSQSPVAPLINLLGVAASITIPRFSRHLTNRPHASAGKALRLRDEHVGYVDAILNQHNTA